MKNLLSFSLAMFVIAVFSMCSIGEDKIINYTACEQLNISELSFASRVISDTFDVETGKGTITIPGKVTEISNNDFYNCRSLITITIPNNIKSIGNLAFAFCDSLRSITIPNSVTCIKGGVFNGCSNLDNLVIESQAFYSENDMLISSQGEILSCWSKDQNICIPEGISSIADFAFSGCDSLHSITLPNTVAYIGDDAFAACTSLKSISIPNSVTSIGYWALTLCDSLRSITIPNSVTCIKGGVFNGCSNLDNLVIESQAFYSENDMLISSQGEILSCWSKDQNICIPDGISSIADLAFSVCSHLYSITLPNSVNRIGEKVFTSCVSLREIRIPRGSKSKFSKMVKDEYKDMLVEID